MRIAVIGGGIGGLCLAHGLRKAGVDVAVYERDLSRTDRLQGYRVHINPDGAAALRECLPAANWERFERSAGSSENGFGFLTEQLKPLLVLDPDEEKHYSASRITLRQVLLDGLDVRFGKRFERYEQGDDITLHFEDGTTASCDVLVGADGIRSRVREQYLPPATLAALFEAAATIPGTTKVEQVDLAGRRGIAVSRTDQDFRHDLIFDAKTYKFLGERDVMVGDLKPYPKNAVTGWTAQLKIAVVDRPGQLP